MKISITNLLSITIGCTLILSWNLDALGQKNYNNREQAATYDSSFPEKSRFDTEEEEEIETPIEEMFENTNVIDINESIFDKKKKKDRDGEKDGSNPPVPIDDYLGLLALGGILLFAFAFKKLF